MQTAFFLLWKLILKSVYTCVGASDAAKKEKFRQKMIEYMGRAEELKKFVKEEKTGKFISGGLYSTFLMKHRCGR